jgi:DNA-binding response OmpR family regulator
VPVILVSASDDPAVDRMAHEAGVPWMLHKPFASSALMAAIQSALKAPPP